MLGVVESQAESDEPRDQVTPEDQETKAGPQ